MVISLLAYLATFSGQFYFWRSYFFTFLQLLRHNSYSFGESISSDQLLFLRSTVFERVISSQQLFFQNTQVLGTKLLPSSHFVKIGSFLEQLLFGTATFLWSNCLDERYLQKSSFDWSRYFCTASAFSEEPHFQKTYFSWRGTFLEQPLFQETLPSIEQPFQKSYFLTRYFFRRVAIS